MMVGLEGLLGVALAFLIVAVSPGPANIAVATLSMRHGRKTGISFGLGLTLGLAFWGLVAATGLGAILQSSAYALTALKVAGGAYLLWLAYQSGRSAMKPKAEFAPAEATAGEDRWFWRGLILNLSNPKAVVAWMAALSMGLGSGDGVAALWVATALCMVIGLANYMGYALVFSLRGFMQGYARVSRWVDGVVAGLFAAAGLGLLRSAATRSLT